MPLSPATEPYTQSFHRLTTCPVFSTIPFEIVDNTPHHLNMMFTMPKVFDVDTRA